MTLAESHPQDVGEALMDLHRRLSVIEDIYFDPDIPIGSLPTQFPSTGITIGVTPLTENIDPVTALTLTPSVFLNDVMINIDWDDPGGPVIEYEIEVAEKDGLSYIEPQIFRTAATSYQVHNLRPSTEYGVRVWSINSIGRRSTPYPSSGFQDVTTGIDETVPAQLTNVTIGRGATTVVVQTDPSADVDVADGHGIYEYQIDTVNTFDGVDFQSMKSSSFIVAFTAESPLDWYARARAIDEFGNEGPWSTIAGPTEAGGVIDSMVVAGLSAAKITVGEMHGDRIQANTLSAAKLTTSDLTAADITLNGGSFKAGTPPTTGLLINSQGIRLYDGGDLTIVLDALTGTAEFSGAITASAISGGTIAGAEISGGEITGVTITGNTISGNTISGGTISGSTITGGTISGTTITGTTISGNTISGGSISGTSISGGSLSGTSISGGSINIGSGTFQVSSGGALTATSATISGSITGSSISGTSISGGSISGTTITGGSINIASGTFQVTSGGALTATSATITGSIQSGSTITGSTISGGTLTNGNLQISSNVLRHVSDSSTRISFAGASNQMSIQAIGGISLSGPVSFTSSITSVATFANQMRAPGMTGSPFPGDAVHRDAGGNNELVYVTSSKRVKKSIKTLTFDRLPSVLNLRPVEFEPKSAADSKRRPHGPKIGSLTVGFIAEEADAVSPLYTTYRDGEPSNIHDRAILAGLVLELQRLDARVQVLEGAQ